MCKIMVLNLSCSNEALISNIEIAGLIMYGLLLSGGCANAYIIFSIPEETTLRAFEQLLKEIRYELYSLERQCAVVDNYDARRQQIIDDGLFDVECALAHLNEQTILQLDQMIEILAS